ncbi:hypothetical protein RFI_36872, partial [Reticulomyxa filosa]
MDIDNKPTNNRKRKLDNDDIYDLNTKKRRTNEQSLQVQVAIRAEVDEKKKDEKINFENMWKFKSRDRHNFLCSSSPTLVITSVIRNAREKLGIKLTRKENAILQKKESPSKLIQIKKKSDNANQYSYTEA